MSTPQLTQSFLRDPFLLFENSGIHPSPPQYLYLLNSNGIPPVSFLFYSVHCVIRFRLGNGYLETTITKTSILVSVSSSQKQIFVLGQPSSGKSTLVSALLHKALSDDQKDAQRTDFAIGYDFADVRDEADESKYSRLQATSNSMLRVH